MKFGDSQDSAECDMADYNKGWFFMHCLFTLSLSNENCMYS